MVPHVPLTERAYELARSGAYRTLLDVERQLKKEGYENLAAALSGVALRKHLRSLCAGEEYMPLAPAVRRKPRRSFRPRVLDSEA